MSVTMTATQMETAEARMEALDLDPGNSATGVVEQASKWNHPRKNMFKTFAAFWCFLGCGLNDAAAGPLIPYLETWYSLNYTVVSLIFLSPFIGYIVASLINTPVHTHLGQRGVAMIAPSCRLVAYIVIANHPPYPVLVVMFLFVGFGIGLVDSAWNSWIGIMQNANEVLGILHAMYGLGGVVAPLVATTLVTKVGVPWYYYYYLMIGFMVIELCISTFAFWDGTAAAFRLENARTTRKSTNLFNEGLARSPAARVTWLCSALLFLYMGVEVALGGWIVTFMSRVRHGKDFASGMVATGFWLGLTVGRVTLGFITPRIGEKRAIAIYLPLTMVFCLVLWLVPNFYASAVAVAFQGFFLGPIFPAAVVVSTQYLPRHLHVFCIGFSTALGGSGAAIFPFLVGALASAKGVWVLQPFVLSMLSVCMAVWLAMPGGWRVKKE